MTSEECEHRLKFLGLTAADEQLLRSLRPLFETHINAIEDAFYQHLLDFPETAQLLQDHTTVERLKRLQRTYLMRITEGNFDVAYFEDRLRIGKTHERVGLTPRWYLLAYNQYFTIITPLIRDYFATDLVRGTAAILALEKVFMLDASLAMDAYIASDRYRHLQQLESIVNDSADVIFSLDEHNHIRTWNRAAEQVFGWRTEEILGKPLTILVPPAILKGSELIRIEQELAAHSQYHWETERLAKDGRHVPVEVTVSALRDPQGNLIGRSAILRDITARKRLEEAKLQSERLATIGAMSAKLAHEIRNPLSSIVLNIDLVHDEINTLATDKTAPATEARSLLKSIDSEVRRIQRVTEDYLQFARLPKLHREQVSLNELLAQGLSFLQSLFDATGVELRTDYDPALPLLQADESQLWQAMLNLIRNAIEAMPQGGTLTVRTAATANRVTVTIRDTGKGMTDAEQAQLFRPFFSTKVGGTGLGLPLTQQIITEHNGVIRCESTPDQGTTFHIELSTELESSHGQTR